LSNSGLWLKNPASVGSPPGVDQQQQFQHMDAAPAITPSPITPLTPSQAGFGGVPSARRPGLGHRHKGSADSISYTQEKGEDPGQTRWVMERRRTAETGEVEFVGREVIEGGTI